MAVNCRKQRRAHRFTPAHIVVFAAVLLVLVACGPKAPKGLRAGPESTAAAVREDSAVNLADGSIARFAAIEIVNPPTAAIEMMKARALGRRVRLYFDGAERDVHGALSAQIYVRDEAGDWFWLQKDLVAAGLARVVPQASDRTGALDLLSFENAARAAKKGLWADPAFAVLAADPAVLSPHMGAYVLVEGKVVSVGRAAHRVFLNFGEDYKTDFTVTIPEEAWPAWPGGAPYLLNLKDEKVRVRGVLSERNGPSIEAVSPAQIEALGPP